MISQGAAEELFLRILFAPLILPVLPQALSGLTAHPKQQDALLKFLCVAPGGGVVFAPLPPLRTMSRCLSPRPFPVFVLLTVQGPVFRQLGVAPGLLVFRGCFQVSHSPAMPVHHCSISYVCRCTAILIFSVRPARLHYGSCFLSSEAATLPFQTYPPSLSPFRQVPI